MDVQLNIKGCSLPKIQLYNMSLYFCIIIIIIVIITIVCLGMNLKLYI